jgi:4'-phosphopantetheinyl transferase
MAESLIAPGSSGSPGRTRFHSQANAGRPYAPAGEHEVHLILARSEPETTPVDELWALLSDEERERASQFRFEVDRASFVAARGLLRVILSKHLDIPPDRVEFCYGPRGKPGLSGIKKKGFNVSHCRGAVLIAIAADHEVGADIERIRPFSGLESFARRYFCEAEYQDLIATPINQREQAFFNCWTRKEAFVKAIGDGLFYPLNRFQVTLKQDVAAQLVSVDQVPADRWSMHALVPWPSYAAAVVVESRVCRFRVFQFDSVWEAAAYLQQEGDAR